MKTYFPDTNFFFECRKALDLPWHELEGVSPSDAQDVRLIIPPTVIEEIDRHKTKGNNRTAKRARDASAILRKAFKSPDNRTDLRTASPRVVLELPPVINVDMSQFPNLDPNKPDHHIAAEYALILINEAGLTVLTDDTLLAIAVRSLGHKPILIPDSWKLEPEKDERDDEIDRLRDELKIYKQASPDVSIRTLDLAGDEIKDIDTAVESFAPSREEVEQAIASIQRKHRELDDLELIQPPAFKASPLFHPPGGSWRPPSAEEIEAYKDAHSRWRQSLSEEMRELPDVLNRKSHEIPFTVEIVNSGFANATDVRLTINSYEGITVLDRDNDDSEEEQQSTPSLPAAPNPPRGTYYYPAVGRFPWTSAAEAWATPIMARSDALASLLRNDFHSRDPNGFYYVNGRPGPGIDEFQLVCEALPHQIEPYFLKFRIIVPREKLEGQPRLRVRLHASNLKRPVDKYIRVSTNLVQGDFLQRVKA
jgi:PIN domain-containing protein